MSFDLERFWAGSASDPPTSARVDGGRGHGVRTRTVVDSAASAGTPPGRSLRTLVAQQANAFSDQGDRL